MSGKKWDLSDDEILEYLYKENIKVKEIANRLNRSINSINQRIIKLGLNIKYHDCRKEKLIGLKNGKLTIIEDLGVFKKDSCIEPHHYIRVQCDCNNKTVFEMQLSNFKNGHRLSCGCDKKLNSNFKDLTGMKFGHLTIIKRVDDYITPKGARKVRYLCQCDCEEQNEVIVWASNLKHGSKTLSCGCHKRKVSRYRGYNTRKYNEYYEYEDIVFVKYSNCNEYFLCDKEDWDYLKYFTWGKGIQEGGYACTVLDGKTYMMHKLIIDCCPSACYVDHEYQVVNGVCDNRKKNLRIANKRQNAQNHVLMKTNSSGYSGVKWIERHKCWESSINIEENKQTRLIRTKNKEEAIKVRLQAEHDYYGIFAPQRYLFKEYGIDDSDLDYESFRFSNKAIQEKYGYEPKLHDEYLISKIKEIKKYTDKED